MSPARHLGRAPITFLFGPGGDYNGHAADGPWYGFWSKQTGFTNTDRLCTLEKKGKSTEKLHYTLEFLFKEIEALFNVLEVLATGENDLT
jgi:hypothetical protein